MKEVKYLAIPLITILIVLVLGNIVDMLFLGSNYNLFDHIIYVFLFFIGYSVILFFVARWHLKNLNDGPSDSKADWDTWEKRGKFQYIVFRNIYIALIIAVVGFIAVFSFDHYGMNRQPSIASLSYILILPFQHLQISNYFKWMYHKKAKSKSET
ncbi:MAG: hypothetical protein GY839_10080 [candidate division Zixibacteria bacterium]|nr:hypothetical protein [candidate division Zixibacteria bacterium]